MADKVIEKAKQSLYADYGKPKYKLCFAFSYLDDGALL
jgi:hypothetical protein